MMMMMVVVVVGGGGGGWNLCEKCMHAGNMGLMYMSYLDKVG